MRASVASDGAARYKRPADGGRASGSKTGNPYTGRVFQAVPKRGRLEFSTEPQEDLDLRRLYWPRGKMLGGSSSMNAMIYMRGARVDYDGWRDLGNAGWGFDDVLPLFKTQENQERGASGEHGVGGPVNVADLRTVNPLTEAFLKACETAGIPKNPDFNGASQTGAGLYQVTQKNGARWSAADAF